MIICDYESEMSKKVLQPENDWGQGRACWLKMWDYFIKVEQN